MKMNTPSVFDIVPAPFWCPVGMLSALTGGPLPPVPSGEIRAGDSLRLGFGDETSGMIDWVPMPPAIDIARRATLHPIADIASQMGIGPELLEPYGAHVAKVSLDAVEALAGRPRARSVVVAAGTPPPRG